MSKVILLSALFFFVGCVEDDENSDTATLQARAFPENFMWGTATAGFQVDMGCDTPCNDLAGDWYQWVTSPIIQDVELDDTHFMVNGDPVEDGPGHWQYYEKDFDLAANTLHNNAHRFGIEWSRLFPTSVTAPV